MRIIAWKEGMDDKITKDIAYQERNLLALYYAKRINVLHRAYLQVQGIPDEEINYPCGWYYDTDNNWDGWKRVLSLDNGSNSFHIPDDFDVGDLTQIDPNWDGHTTDQKWTNIMKYCGCKMEDDTNES